MEKKHRGSEVGAGAVARRALRRGWPSHEASALALLVLVQQAACAAEAWEEAERAQGCDHA